MKNYVSPGNVLPFTAAATHPAGDVVVVGSLVGVVSTSVVSGEVGQAVVEGVFDLVPAAAAVASLTNGAKAYWKDATNEVTADSADVHMGYVFGSNAVSGSVKVKLAPTDAVV